MATQASHVFTATPQKQYNRTNTRGVLAHVVGRTASGAMHHCLQRRACFHVHTGFLPQFCEFTAVTRGSFRRMATK